MVLDGASSHESLDQRSCDGGILQRFCLIAPVAGQDFAVVRDCGSNEQRPRIFWVFQEDRIDESCRVVQARFGLRKLA